MTLEDAVTAVLECAAAGTIFSGPEELNTVKEYFRKNEGFIFAGDDALGKAYPAKGDSVTFLPLTDNPPKGRPSMCGPIAGKVERANDCYPHPGFPFLIRLEDAHFSSKCTRVWASREEVHIVRINQRD